MPVSDIKLFLTASGNWFMFEIAQIFAEGFEQNGICTQIVADFVPSLQVGVGEIQIIVAPHEFYPLFLEKKIPPKEIQNITEACYFLTVEQPGSSWFEIAFQYSKWARGIFDINMQGVDEFRQRGVKAFYFPLGYSNILEAVNINPKQVNSVEKPIDILFLGSNSPRRESFLAKYAYFFNKYQSKLIISRVERPRKVNTPGFYSGSERNQILQRSKILMNIHFGDRTYLEWHRFLICAANRCLLISELSDRVEPLINGKHLILAELDKIPIICEYYLNHQDELREIADQAYAFVKQEYNSKLLCRIFLSHLEAEM